MHDSPRRDAARSGARARQRGFLGLDDVVLMADSFAGQDAADQSLGPLRLRSAWRRAVGETLARASHPAGIQGESLRVEVRDAAWKRELERLEPLIRGRMGRLLPSRPIQRIQFEVVRGAFRPTGPARNRRSGASSPPASGTAGDLFAASPVDLSGRFSEVMGRYLREES